MKKLLSIILSLVIFVSSVITVTFADETNVTNSESTFYINNIYTDIEVLKMNDVDVVPLKELCNRLGYIVSEKENGKIEITKADNCKNSLGATDKAEFEIGNRIIKIVNKDGNSSEIDMMTSTVIQYNDEIYLPAFYISRMLNLKNQHTADHKIGVLTQDYIADSGNNQTQVRGTIFVRSLDGENPQIEIDRKVVPFVSSPFIDENGRTQVPVREFCEYMNMSIDWFENPQRVAISSVPPNLDKSNGGNAGGASYWFVIGEKRCRRNGTYYNIDTAAQIIDGKTYIPLKYLAEMINYNIAFNPVSPALSEIGYGYATMLSYLGLDKNVVLRELGLDDSNIASSSKQDYVKEIGANIGRRTLGVRFENEKLSSFFYAYSDYAQSKKIMQNIKECLTETYGEPYVPTDVKGINEIPDGYGDDEYGSYFNAWDIGLNDTKKVLTLQFDYAPEGYFVHVIIT